MAPMVVAFVLGWWLVARSRAQHREFGNRGDKDSDGVGGHGAGHGGLTAVVPVPARQPLLSLHPCKGVALGDNVTLRCHLPRPALQVLLYRNKAEIRHQYSTGEQNTAEFVLEAIEWGHTGTYQCQYEDKERKMSALSDPVELLVTDLAYPPPGTMLSPSRRVETGTNVTIQCWESHGATFLLHKDGCSPPIQRQDPHEGAMATFTLLGVTPADAGTYRCSYSPHWQPFLSSPLGDKVTLEVTPASGAPRGKGEPPTLPPPHLGAEVPPPPPSVTHGWLCHHFPSPGTAGDEDIAASGPPQAPRGGPGGPCLRPWGGAALLPPPSSSASASSSSPPGDTGHGAVRAVAGKGLNGLGDTPPPQMCHLCSWGPP
ncbi:Osteoclast-associated immunoglobulin-like receptor [Aix galericulata]|nr:Osteoclast-associated immunoglobulin-like receptor [Aix galericulata]